jgi:hypothetical protein
MRDRRRADELHDLLTTELPIEGAPKDLVRLATVATTLRDSVELERPDPAFRAALRAELLEVAAAGRVTTWSRLRDRVDEATARWRHSLRVAVASATASTLLGTAGVAAASQAALPGDALYSVKRWTEDARLAFASGDVAQGRLHLAFARERLDEIEVGLHRLDSDAIVLTLAAMDEDAALGAEQLLAAHVRDGEPGLIDEVRGFTASQAETLRRLSTRLPLTVLPAVETSLEVLRRIDVQTTAVVEGLCAVCGTDGVAAASPRIVLPGVGPALGAGCDCIAPLGPTAPRERAPSDELPLTTDDGGAVAGDMGDEPLSSSSSDRLLVPELPGPLDDAGVVIDGLLDDLLSPTELETVVDDVSDGLGDAVDEVATTIDEVTEGAGTLLDEVTEPLVGDLLSPSPAPTGLVDGLLEP